MRTLVWWTLLLALVRAQVVNWTVEDYRPIAKVLDELEKRYRVRVTYEDAPYVYEGDLEDQAAPEYRAKKIKALVVAKSIVEASLAIGRDGQLEYLGTVLQRILDYNNQRGNPGVFGLRQIGEVYHVVPIRVKNRRGVLEDVNSILDTSVSLPFQQRRLGDTLQAVFNAIGEKTGRKMMLGSGIGPNLIIQSYMAVGADNEPARDVLLRALDETGRKYSWRVFYQPGWGYAFNVRTVGE